MLDEDLRLSRDLTKYVQDVDVHGVKITHRLKFVVALLNPDGHTSEVRGCIARKTRLMILDTSIASHCRLYITKHAHLARWSLPNATRKPARH